MTDADMMTGFNILAGGSVRLVGGESGESRSSISVLWEVSSMDGSCEFREGVIGGSTLRSSENETAGH